MNTDYDLFNYQKQDLIKYCYLDDSYSYLRESLISLINNCKNAEAINFIHKFFIQAIYPYYMLQRTVFNRVRSYFMKQTMIALLQCLIEQNDYKQAFLDEYYNWCNNSKVNDYIQTKNEYKQIQLKLVKFYSTKEDDRQLKLALSY